MIDAATTNSDDLAQATASPIRSSETRSLALHREVQHRLTDNFNLCNKTLPPLSSIVSFTAKNEPVVPAVESTIKSRRTRPVKSINSKAHRVSTASEDASSSCSVSAPTSLLSSKSATCSSSSTITTTAIATTA